MIRRALVVALCLFVCKITFHVAPAQSQPQSPGFENLTFRMVGPTRGGRVTAVAGHRKHPGTFYMGATGGGVWKTMDYGITWEPVSDGYFATGSIGSIDVADSDADIVYVGTGSEAIRSNVILGKGIYKSTDAGKTWRHLGLEKTGQIGAVVVHPTKPEVVYVAALGSPFGRNPERGVYKTSDGGTTWQQVLFLSDQTGFVDLELNPANPDEVYATAWHAERKPWTILSGADTEDGIYKSTDAGQTWRKLEAGLPQGLIGKIDLATSPADPDRIYAQVEAPQKEEGLYVSTDRGESWQLINDDPRLMTRPFYYTNLDADPTNADIVYVNNLGFHKSVDGGKTFSRISTPHGDNHDMWINPDNPEIFIQANDGGANVTINGGKTWSSLHNQPTAELYQVNVDDDFPYRLYAGQQDNSTIAVPSLPPLFRPGGAEGHWEAIGGCETGPAVPRPGDSNIVYSNCKGGFGRYNRATGQEQSYFVGAMNIYGHNPRDLPYRFQRVTPLSVSPHNPDVIYFGSQYVHRTMDEGKTWETISPDLTANSPERQVISGSPITRDITGEEIFSTLYVIQESPLEPGVIWTGANDGPVHVSRDNGQTWTKVTPPMPSEGRIQTIEPSPHQPGKAYVAAYRYLLNDWRPYLFRTTNYGQSWTLLTDGTNGIPEDFPTRVVREDPDREGLLYAGTEFGFFLSFDDGQTWQRFQQNLPVTPVTDIKVHRQDVVLSTMGRSFWILDNVTPLHQFTAEVAEAAAFLFQPRDAYRLRYAGGAYDATEPSYPSPGVMIDYYLGQDAKTLILEILDDEGKVIHKTTSQTRQADRPQESQAMRGPMRRRSQSTLDHTAGFHRVTWNMRQDGSGVMVPPGTYQVRLSTGSWEFTRPFTLLIDPRIAADQVTQDDLEAQYQFNLQVHDALTEANDAVKRIEKARKDLQLDNDEARQLDQALKVLEATWVTDSEEVSYPQPMLIDQWQYLLGMTSRADHRPGRDAYERFDTLHDQQKQLLTQLETLLQQAGSR